MKSLMVIFRPINADPTAVAVAINRVIPKFTVERDQVEAQRLIKVIPIMISASF